MTKETKIKLYQIAGSLNNHPALIHSDHVTIMAFMDTEKEMQDHIDSLQKRISEYKPKKGSK